MSLEHKMSWTSNLKFIQDYIQDLSDVFSVASLVNIFNTISLFPPLTVYVNSQFVYVIKRKKKKMVAWRYEFYLLVLKTILYSDAVLFLKILFLPLKNKISIFAISSVFKFLVIFGDQSIYSSFPRPLQVLCVYYCSENNAKVCF